MWQALLEKGGADRATGYRIQEAERGKASKILGFGHQMLFGDRFGADVLMRRVGAKSFLMAKFDPAAIKRVAGEVNSGEKAPLTGALEIEKMIGPSGVLGLARDVNSTFGYNNRLLRPDVLNAAQRGMPYIGSQSGMIPGEIRRTVGLNLSPSKIAAQVRGGRYSQAATSIASSLMSGPIGSWIAMQALNMMLGKSRGEDPESTLANPGKHKFDVKLGGKWYLSNWDPGLTRALRLTGAKTGVEEGDAKKGIADIPREIANEAMSSVAPLLKLLFTGASGKVPYLTPRRELMKAPPGALYPLGAGRDIAAAAAGGKDSIGDAAAKTAASMAGYRITNDSNAPAFHRMPGQAKPLRPHFRR